MLSLIDIAESVRAGECSAVDMVENCLAAIEDLNERFNAFVYLD